MNDNIENISNQYIESYKKLNVNDKKKELLERLKTQANNYRTVCESVFGVNKSFVNGLVEKVDINNDDEFLNALFSFVVEIDNQVGTFVEKTIK